MTERPVSRTAPVFSLGVPVQPRLPGDVVPYGRLVQRSGAHRLWFGQSRFVDPHQMIPFLAGMGIRVPYGTSVALAPLRHPYDAAIQARAIATLSGETYVAGYGAATPAYVAGLRGRPYRSPKSAIVEYTSLVRRLLDGETLDVEGEYFVQRAMEPLESSESSPRVEVGAGVLRPRMAEAAGAVIDAAITWLTPPRYLSSTILPALAAGGLLRGGLGPRTVSLVQIAVRRPGRDPAELADFCAGLHLTAPHYRSMLRDAGVRLGEDPKANAGQLVDNGVFLYGSPEGIAAELRDYHRRGVHEVVLKATGPHCTEGMRAGLDDLTAVLDCLGLLRGRTPERTSA